MRCSPAAVLVLLALSLPAVWSQTKTITFGQPDGERHPNVGALVAEYIVPGQKDVICSGTLIGPGVFLTAAHCTAYLQSIGIAASQVWVTFDAQFRDSGTFHKGTMHTNPAYNWRQADPGDLAVVVLDTPIVDIAPASLPPVGLLDQLAVKNGLKDQPFTAVGYGASELRIGGGPPSYTYPDTRKYGVEKFNALNAAWIHLSQNPATGNSGACYGDSGGPNFLGNLQNEDLDHPGMVVAITVTGDAMCRATNVVYRLDTPSARAFLEGYLATPD